VSADRNWFCPNLQQPSVLERCSHPYRSSRITPSDNGIIRARVWERRCPVTRALADAANLTGHRQITDAYLLALTSAHSGMLATLDRGLLNLSANKDSANKDRVHIITEAH
jgi:hypothetical protein